MERPSYHAIWNEPLVNERGGISTVATPSLTCISVISCGSIWCGFSKLFSAFGSEPVRTLAVFTSCILMCAGLTSTSAESSTLRLVRNTSRMLPFKTRALSTTVVSPWLGNGYVGPSETARRAIPLVAPEIMAKGQYIDCTIHLSFSVRMGAITFTS